MLSQNYIQSRTLVCFLDSSGNLHDGFAYRNGSNLRVVCWQNNERTNRTVPKGNLVIAFKECQTPESFGHYFGPNDFNMPWFDTTARGIVKEELGARALHSSLDTLDNTANKLARLTIY